MYETLLDSILHFLRNGISWASLVGVLVLFLKNRRLKRLINRRLPRILRDMEEDKLDWIIRHMRVIMKQIGVKEECAPTYDPTTRRSVKGGAGGSTFFWAARSAARSASKSTNLLLRRTTKMREYLKKLGRTKFQAFLVVTITNLAILAGYLTGNINLEGQLDVWMPAINLVVQVVATAVYTWVEGAIDKATAGSRDPRSVMTPDPDQSVKYN